MPELEVSAVKPVFQCLKCFQFTVGILVGTKKKGVKPTFRLPDGWITNGNKECYCPECLDTFSKVEAYRTQVKAAERRRMEILRGK
jgi:Zn finger protein HypA/HybF involved in hydrogenase expression